MINAFHHGFSNILTKMQIGTAVRIGLMKRLIREYLPKELSVGTVNSIENFMMICEEETTLSSQGTNLGARLINLYGNRNVTLNLRGKDASEFIYDIEYRTNKYGQVLDYRILQETKEIVYLNRANELAMRFKGWSTNIHRMTDPEEEKERLLGIDENGVPLYLQEIVKSGKTPTREEIENIFRNVMRYANERGKKFPIEELALGVCNMLISHGNVLARRQMKTGEYIYEERDFCNERVLKEFLKKDSRRNIQIKDYSEEYLRKQLCDDFIGVIFELYKECSPGFDETSFLLEASQRQKEQFEREVVELSCERGKVKKKKEKAELDGKIEEAKRKITRGEKATENAVRRVKKITEATRASKIRKNATSESRTRIEDVPMRNVSGKDVHGDDENGEI